MEIIKADINNLTEAARLFDLYRQFYECPADTELTTRFIKERIENNESDIFLSIDGSQPVDSCSYIRHSAQYRRSKYISFMTCTWNKYIENAELAKAL